LKGEEEVQRSRKLERSYSGGRLVDRSISTSQFAEEERDIEGNFVGGKKNNSMSLQLK